MPPKPPPPPKKDPPDKEGPSKDPKEGSSSKPLSARNERYTKRHGGVTPGLPLSPKRNKKKLDNSENDGDQPPLQNSTSSGDNNEERLLSPLTEEPSSSESQSDGSDQKSAKKKPMMVYGRAQRPPPVAVQGDNPQTPMAVDSDPPPAPARRSIFSRLSPLRRTSKTPPMDVDPDPPPAPSPRSLMSRLSPSRRSNTPIAVDQNPPPTPTSSSPPMTVERIYRALRRLLRGVKLDELEVDFWSDRRDSLLAHVGDEEATEWRNAFSKAEDYACAVNENPLGDHRLSPPPRGPSTEDNFDSSVESDDGSSANASVTPTPMAVDPPPPLHESEDPLPSSSAPLDAEQERLRREAIRKGKSKANPEEEDDEEPANPDDPANGKDSSSDSSDEDGEGKPKSKKRRKPRSPASKARRRKKKKKKAQSGDEEDEFQSGRLSNEDMAQIDEWHQAGVNLASRLQRPFRTLLEIINATMVGTRAANVYCRWEAWYSLAHRDRLEGPSSSSRDFLQEMRIAYWEFISQFVDHNADREEQDQGYAEALLEMERRLQGEFDAVPNMVRERTARSRMNAAARDFTRVGDRHSKHRDIGSITFIVYHGTNGKVVSRFATGDPIFEGLASENVGMLARIRGAVAGAYAYRKEVNAFNAAGGTSQPSATPSNSNPPQPDSNSNPPQPDTTPTNSNTPNAPSQNTEGNGSNAEPSAPKTRERPIPPPNGPPGGLDRDNIVAWSRYYMSCLLYDILPTYLRGFEWRHFLRFSFNQEVTIEGWPHNLPLPDLTFNPSKLLKHNKDVLKSVTMKRWLPAMRDMKKNDPGNPLLADQALLIDSRGRTRLTAAQSPQYLKAVDKSRRRERAATREPSRRPILRTASPRRESSSSPTPSRTSQSPTPSPSRSSHSPTPPPSPPSPPTRTARRPDHRHRTATPPPPYVAPPPYAPRAEEVHVAYPGAEGSDPELDVDEPAGGSDEEEWVPHAMRSPAAPSQSSAPTTSDGDDDDDDDDGAVPPPPPAVEPTAETPDGNNDDTNNDAVPPPLPSAQPIAEPHRPHHHVSNPLDRSNNGLDNRHQPPVHRHPHAQPRSRPLATREGGTSASEPQHAHASWPPPGYPPFPPPHAAGSSSQPMPPPGYPPFAPPHAGSSSQPSPYGYPPYYYNPWFPPPVPPTDDSEELPRVRKRSHSRSDRDGDGKRRRRR